MIFSCSSVGKPRWHASKGAIVTGGIQEAAAEELYPAMEVLEDALQSDLSRPLDQYVVPAADGVSEKRYGGFDAGEMLRLHSPPVGFARLLDPAAVTPYGHQETQVSPGEQVTDLRVQLA